ncbi:MAG: hypothetical protein R2867_13595 [Caldilineaceae bacterium]
MFSLLAPLHVAMQAVLSRRDGSNALSMATATTDGKGLAAMDFVIPGEWADHTPIVDNTLLPSPLSLVRI